MKSGLFASLAARLRRRSRLIDQFSCLQDPALHLVVQQAATGLAVIQNDGQIVLVNDSLRRMVGPVGVVGPGRPVIALFAEPSHAEGLHLLRQGIAPAGFNAALAGPAGAQRMAAISVQPVREADGGVSGAILYFTDISTQHRLEMQLAESQKMQAVGQLAAGIAHDFNNLLTAIIGAADEAIDRCPADPLTLEDLQQIRASAGRGAGLVGQLLAFGRQQVLQPRILAINDAVVEIAGLLRRLLGRHIRLDLDLESPSRLVRIDPTQLGQVLINLAINAGHAMPEGGRLTLRTSRVMLYRDMVSGADTIPPGSYVVLEVEDTGIGMAPEMLPRIFDPFFTTRREQGGSGLGLSTVHGIVRQSGGHLTVESQPGQGSCFRIYLPRQETLAPVTPLPTAATRQAATAPAGRLVLFVDDEEGVRRLAIRALTKQGWTVLAAESGDEALALLQQDPARLDALCAVITDVVMPGMDGPSLLRAIRDLRQGVPAILASGYAEAAVHGELALDGVVFLTKPYVLKAMMETLERLALTPEPAARA